MTSASQLFRTYGELVNLAGKFSNQGQFELEEGCYHLPLYEAKMVHHYDHRWATYETDGVSSRDCTLSEKQDPSYHSLPRYWVDSWQVTLRTTEAPREIINAARQDDTDALFDSLILWVAGKALLQGDRQVAESLLDEPQPLLFDKNLSDKAKAALEMVEQWPLEDGEYSQLLDVVSNRSVPWPLTEKLLESRRPKYLLGWRRNCRSNDERTLISTIIPFSAVGDSIFLMNIDNEIDARKKSCLFGCLNALVFDFICRQKVGGVNFSFYYMAQLPVLSPDIYTEADINFIVPRVLELTYTSYDLQPFALDLGYDGEPFHFDPDRRHRLKSELDAYYAKLYGLTREELLYILDPAEIMGEDYPSESFRVLKNNEINRFGEYKTRRLVLEAWDKLEQI